MNGTRATRPDLLPTVCVSRKLLLSERGLQEKFGFGSDAASTAVERGGEGRAKDTIKVLYTVIRSVRNSVAN